MLDPTADPGSNGSFPNVTAIEGLSAAARKILPRQLEWSAKDFVPAQDMRVLLLSD